eukprot:CAMPEP_0176420292 /NCGR_PEP_ID=MMETSP0127-20121128/8526_1 /TAXON_ID=938130 /ORGANISM="Platyophrya macrostoma, Strain WH" /LENGTH=319 /DNA_ID=CAMNT_0017800873 /DNA_START=254 /DNA_END=1217 /DNA_ORIENTATION=+
MNEEPNPEILLKTEADMDLEFDYPNYEADSQSQWAASDSKAEIVEKIEFCEEPEDYCQDENAEMIDYQAVEGKIRKNLGKVRDMIEAILRGKEIRGYQLEELGDFEKAIITFINQKKSKSEGTKISKRREEKQKLFFKAALKQIENNFLINVLKCRSTLRKKEADVNAFYVLISLKLQAEKGFDITVFYPPCQKRRFRHEGNEDFKNEIKSFNLRYIELLLCSKKFRDETVEYLEEEFAQGYTKLRFKKIDKLLEHAMNALSQSYKQAVRANNVRPGDILKELIVNNPKSKLPWSDAELEETKEFARLTIEKISLNMTN